MTDPFETLANTPLDNDPGHPVVAPIPGWPQPRRDPLGMIYDTKYTDTDGVEHYVRNSAKGTGGGPARWSSEHDCNPIGGCHLSAKCTGCNACMNCDGCYCFED